MFHRFENFEQPKETRQEQAEDLPRARERHLEQAKATDGRSSEAVEKARHSAAGSRFQGDIGEGLALRVSTEKLNLTPDPRFDAKHRGFDAVCRDEQGKLVIIESKFDDRGINALRKDQMQPEWVDRTARMMQNPGNERYTSGNAEIGREIQRMAPGEIRRVVITTDPGTLEVRAYEANPAGKWQEIGRWSALEFEQPML